MVAEELISSDALLVNPDSKFFDQVVNRRSSGTVLLCLNLLNQKIFLITRSFILKKEKSLSYQIFKKYESSQIRKFSINLKISKFIIIFKKSQVFT